MADDNNTPTSPAKNAQPPGPAAANRITNGETTTAPIAGAGAAGRAGGASSPGAEGALAQLQPQLCTETVVAGVHLMTCYDDGNDDCVFCNDFGGGGTDSDCRERTELYGPDEPLA